MKWKECIKKLTNKYNIYYTHIIRMIYDVIYMVTDKKGNIFDDRRKETKSVSVERRKPEKKKGTTKKK